MNQTDLMNQSWTSRQDVNNSFFAGNERSIGTTQSISYDYNQYSQPSISTPFSNQSTQIINDERPSKKVQFAYPMPHQTLQTQVTQRHPLTTTQSWHESSVTNSDTSQLAIARSNAVVNNQLTHRAIQSIPTSLSQVQVATPKPIYVSIDHRATIAERGQSNGNIQVRKTNERGSTDGLNVNINTHRARFHTQNQQTNIDTIDSFTSKVQASSSRSTDIPQGQLFGPQRPVTNTVSTTTMIPNKILLPDIPIGTPDHDRRANRGKRNRLQSLQNIEHQSLVNDEFVSSRSRANQSLTKQPRLPVMRTDSPLRTTASQNNRQMDNRTSGAPMMRIRIPQQRQQQQQQQSQRTAIKRTDSPLRSETDLTKRQLENKTVGTSAIRISAFQRQHKSRHTATSSATAHATRTRV
jgi:hypothetical protein